MAKQGGTFSAEEVRYLKRLPAVANVTRSRITYAESFKRESLKRYLAGESPVKLFREAGLDPALIGYKRIERSFSRWKERARQIGTRPDDERESADMERASAALFAPETRYASERPPRTRPLDFFGGGGVSAWVTTCARSSSRSRHAASTSSSMRSTRWSAASPC